MNGEVCDEVFLRWRVWRWVRGDWRVGVLILHRVMDIGVEVWGFLEGVGALYIYVEDR